MTRPLGVGSPSPSPPATRSGRHFRPAAGKGGAQDCRYGRGVAVPHEGEGGSEAGPVRSRSWSRRSLSGALRAGRERSARGGRGAVGAGPEEGTGMRGGLEPYRYGARELGSEETAAGHLGAVLRCLRGACRREGKRRRVRWRGEGERP